MIANFIVFIPFGLLLSSNFKKVTFWQKIFTIFIFSLAIETIQYLLAIGVSDITDVIMNTLGGLSGVMVYSISKRYVDSRKMDRISAAVIAILLVFLLFLRFFVFKVKY